jgi:hypothetical protein
MPVNIINKLRTQNRLSAEDKIMVFQVDFGFFPIGRADFENKGIITYQNQQVYHLLAKASVVKWLSHFFNAQAIAESFIDKNKLHTIKFTQTLVMPDKPKDFKEINYDQKNNIMELRGVKRQILPDTQDPLSALFFIRRQSLKTGGEFDININTNQKNYGLVGKVVRKEEYLIEGKKTGVWVLQGDIARRDKSSRHKSSIIIWLLDNNNKTPILIKAFTSGGTVVARLVDIK